MEGDAVEIIKSLFRCLRIFSRLPHVNQTKISHVIRRANCEERPQLVEDLKELNRSDKRQFIFITLIISLLFSFRNDLFILRTLFLLSESELLPNFVFQSQAKTIQFACMTTNCTRLMNARPIVDDLSQLPIFVLCDPLEHYYPAPIKYLDKIGLLVVAIFGFANIANGILLPTLQLVAPVESEFCMFVQTPRLAVALIKERLTSIAIRMKQCQRHEEPTRWTRYNNSFLPPWESYNQCDGRNCDSGYSRHSRIAENNQSIGREFIDNCIPTVRTKWFYRKLIQAMCVLCGVYSLTVFVFAYSTLVWFLDARVDVKSGYMDMIDDQVQKNNCSVWLTSDKSQSTLEFGGVDMSWSLSGILEYTIQLGPLFITAMGSMTFALTGLELLCWQSELKNQLLFLVEFKHLSNKFESHQRASDERFLTNHPTRLRLVFCLVNEAMVRLQSEFKHYNGTSLFFFKTSLIRSRLHNLPSPRLSSSLAFEEMSHQILESINSSGQSNVSPTEVNLFLMERVYVNLRLYLEMINHYIPFMGAIVSLGYFMLYGLIILTIWYCRKVSITHVEGLMLTVAMVFIYMILTLMLCSKVHARVGRYLRRVPLLSLMGPSANLNPTHS